MTAAASLGGLALLAQRFAGVGADAFNASIANTANAIYRMRNGLNPEMFRVTQR